MKQIIETIRCKKRLLAILSGIFLVIVLPASILAQSGIVTEQNIKDAILERRSFTNAELQAMDMNSDGKVDVADLVWFLDDCEGGVPPLTGEHVGIFYSFTANGSQGDIANPWITDCNDCNSTQTIPLTSGWNWISFNTLPEDNSVDNVLSIYPAKNNDEIKTSDEVCTFYTDKWYCNRDSKIRPGAMYLLKVQTQNPDDLIIEGCPGDAPDGVSILSGWNWIGFNLQNEMDMNTALGSLNLSDGDEIKTWDQVCTYYDGKWWCSHDSKMKPGYGYLLRTDKPGTLIYPEYTARSKTRRRTIQAAKSEYSGPDWSPMPGMQYTMVIHTRVQLDNNHFIESERSILAAFKDDECRGAVKISSSPSGKYFQLLAASNETSEPDLVLKVYDAETGQVCNIRDSFDFAADETIGFISDPVISIAEEDSLADFISALWFGDR